MPFSHRGLLVLLFVFFDILWSLLHFTLLPAMVSHLLTNLQLLTNCMLKILFCMAFFSFLFFGER